MNFINKLFKKSDTSPDLPQWVKDVYKKKEEETALLKGKYLDVVNSFDFGKYLVFSKLCMEFRLSFPSIVETRDLEYCEYHLKLSPKVNFPAKRLEGEVKEYRWKSGVVSTVFYDPPILIGDVTLRPGILIDNSRWIDCFQLVGTCEKCGDIISGVRCYGIATIGHALIYNHPWHGFDCPVVKREYHEELTRKSIERLVG